MSIPNTKNKTYKCSYCDTEYDTTLKAENCRQAHDLVYVEISRSDLNRLMNFIYSGEQNLITDSMIKSIRRSLTLRR